MDDSSIRDLIREEEIAEKNQKLKALRSQQNAKNKVQQRLKQERQAAARR